MAMSMGLWIAENEGVKFWLSVMHELKNRGLQDVLIAAVDESSALAGELHANERIVRINGEPPRSAKLAASALRAGALALRS